MDAGEVRMKKVGIIGSGYWGKNLVRNFNALGCLGAICDKDPKILVRIKNSYPNIPCVSNFDQLLNHDGLQIDGIVIATPAETHYQMAKKAILSGKHAFVEKPLALIESEGQELVDLSEQNQKTLMVGHILHYHPAIVKLKELIDSGELGRIQYIYSNRLNMGKIRSEENILWSFAPHDISVMLMLLEEFPLSVASSGGNYVQPKITDVTMTTLNFPSGVKGHIFVSWLHPFKEQKLVVVGDKNMAVFDDLSNEKLFVYPHSIEWHHRQPVAVKAKSEIVPLNSMEPLRVECQHFVDCISNGKKPKTDGHEGLRVLKILNACEASLRSGGIKVDLFSNHIGLESKTTYVRDSQTVSDSDNQPKLEQKYFIHESCYVDENVGIGEGTKIWHYSHILKNSQIGNFCNIGQNVVIGPDVMVGDRCKIQNNVSIYKGVTLEDEVFCGPSMVFTNVYNPRASIRRMDEIRVTLVKHGATIGANATIVCGVTIGRYAFVGAGSVVTKDVDDHALIVGNPGQQIGWICECGLKLNADLVCDACGKKYRKTKRERESITPRS
jgi:UDP-2-acetamido-3-amino-2,3-dideoxy-glucuronate N-acetyltransferase